jgi:hypothetical protein
MGGSAIATSIVCIRSPESIVIAADSMLTVRNGDKTGAAKSECKIRQAGGTFFTLSGLYKDPVRGFDVIRIINDSLDDKISLPEGAEVVSARVSADLLVELNRLKSESPDDYNTIKMRGGAVTSILLTGFEKGTAEVVLLKFKPTVAPGGETVIKAERNSCPGDCNPGNIQAFYLTDMKAIDDYLKKGNKIDWQNPEKAAKFQVGLVIDAHTPGVAPPVDLLRIDRDGALWIERKPECPEITGSSPTL